MAMVTAVRQARLPILIFRQSLRFHLYPDWKLELPLEPLLLPQTTLPVSYLVSFLLSFSEIIF
jgi:hypothetical protein